MISGNQNDLLMNKPAVLLPMNTVKVMLTLEQQVIMEKQEEFFSGIQIEERQ
jgi:hypothetical protein